MRIQDLLALCLGKWHWFVVSLVITLGLATVYLLRTPPVYTRSASLLIKEDSKGQSLSGDVSSTFADMGLFQANTNVNNELLSLQSPAVMLDVVKRLHLDVSYKTDGTFYKKVLYGQDLPVSLTFCDLQDNEAAALTLQPLEEGQFLLSEFQLNGEKTDSETPVRVSLNDTVRTPLGKVLVEPSPYYDEAFKAPLYVTRTALHAATEGYMKRLAVSLSDEKATVTSEISSSEDNDPKYDSFFSGEASVYSQVGGSDLFWGFKHNWRHYFSFMHNWHSGVVDDYTLYGAAAIAVALVLCVIFL